MKKLFSRLVLSSLVFVAAGASAGSNTGFTQVAQISYTSLGFVKVYFPVATVTGMAACVPASNVGNEYGFVFDSTTPAGKALLAGLLEAHSAGIPVWMFGSGACDVLAGFESVASFNTQN